MEKHMDSNGSMSKVTSGAHDVVDRAQSAASDAADEAVRRAKPVLDRAARAAHHAVDRAAGAATPAADWLSAQAEAVRTAPDRIAENGREAISNHPWKAVGIALALGLLLGRVLL
jgi:ElaB/YqjD/DUF883 family membrane-anchored ribosome-binding protein